MWPARLIKVCGIRTVEHALVAAHAGADCIGLIFAPARRQITPEQGNLIVLALRDAGLHTQTVGVFVNESSAMINSIASTVGLDIIQLSGDEPATMADELRLPLLKALRLDGSANERDWMNRADERIRLHVDAHVAGSYGGAGVLADWGRAQTLAIHTPIVLAGGLDPANVANALHAVQPWGVDVRSGVETDGIKDNLKIHQFIVAARQAMQSS